MNNKLKFQGASFRVWTLLLLPRPPTKHCIKFGDIHKLTAFIKCYSKVFSQINVHAFCTTYSMRHPIPIWN